MVNRIAPVDQQSAAFPQYLDPVSTFATPSTRGMGWRRTALIMNSKGVERGRGAQFTNFIDVQSSMRSCKGWYVAL